MWREYLARLQDEFRPERKKTGGIPDFQKGFCHAHEGYQIYNGYISNRSDIALGKLARMGANAVSISPYSYMRNATDAAPFPFARQAGSENDESIIHAVLAAKKSGLAVLLKPHVWIRGGWPGQVQMSSPGEWDRFFGYYWAWIRHYAVLAEMYDVEIFCVGVEFSGATVGHEKEWIQIFQRVRGVFSGALTYAANWGGEIESVSFWGELDYIGVNFFYPLGGLNTPTDAQLLEGANAGVYWWKWPTYLEYGGPRHSGFTPNGKAAEKIVARWFGGFAGQRPDDGGKQ
jgi:hypothetical protein